jgi:thiamine pyrophosphokinase
VIILGGLGARWDMTIANIHLIAHPMFAGLHIRLLDGTQELRLLRAGDRSVIHGRSGDTLSLIPLAGDVSGIITSGLEYQLNDETLHFGSSRGVSNVLIQDQADILFRQGVLLCIVNKAGN